MQTLLCNTCGNIKEICNFYIHKSKYKDKIYIYYRTPCKTCILKQTTDWRKNNPERYHKTFNERKYKRRIKLINEMGGKCVCCGLTQWWILTLDHIKPIRRKNHERTNLTDLLLKNPEMRKDFQVMCYGCNNSKNSHKECKLNHSINV